MCGVGGVCDWWCVWVWWCGVGVVGGVGGVGMVCHMDGVIRSAYAGVWVVWCAGVKRDGC